MYSKKPFTKLSQIKENGSIHNFLTKLINEGIIENLYDLDLNDKKDEDDLEEEIKVKDVQ